MPSQRSTSCTARSMPALVWNSFMVFAKQQWAEQPGIGVCHV
jgi:hypothetical protein